MFLTLNADIVVPAYTIIFKWCRRLASIIEFIQSSCIYLIPFSYLQNSLKLMDCLFFFRLFMVWCFVRSFKCNEWYVVAGISSTYYYCNRYSWGSYRLVLFQYLQQYVLSFSGIHNAAREHWNELLAVTIAIGRCNSCFVGLFLFKTLSFFD